MLFDVTLEYIFRSSSTAFAERIQGFPKSLCNLLSFGVLILLFFSDFQIFAYFSLSILTFIDLRKSSLCGLVLFFDDLVYFDAVINGFSGKWSNFKIIIKFSFTLVFSSLPRPITPWQLHLLKPWPALLLPKYCFVFLTLVFRALNQQQILLPPCL